MADARATLRRLCFRRTGCVLSSNQVRSVFGVLPRKPAACGEGHACRAVSRAAWSAADEPVVGQAWGQRRDLSAPHSLRTRQRREPAHSRVGAVALPVTLGQSGRRKPLDSRLCTWCFWGSRALRSQMTLSRCRSGQRDGKATIVVVSTTADCTHLTSM